MEAQNVKDKSIVMNRVFALFLLLLMFTTSLCAALQISQPPQATSKSFTQTNTSLPAVPVELQTKFITAAPGTQIQRNNTKINVKVGTQVFQGDVVLGGQGDCDIRLGAQGTLRLKSGGRLIFSTLQRQSKNDRHTVDNRVKIERGAYMARLNTLRGHSRFIVEVPGATALSLGGSFYVQVARDKTYLMVADGSIALAHDERATASLLNDQTTPGIIFINSGHKVELPLVSVPRSDTPRPLASQPLTAAEKEQLSELSVIPFDETSKPQPVVQTLPSSSGRAAAFSPRSNIAALGNPEGTVSFWDLNSGAIWRSQGAHMGRALDVAFSLDGHLVASGGADKKVILWDAPTGESGQVLLGHPSTISALQFADKRTLVVAGGNSVTVFDVRTAKKLRQWNLNGMVMSLAIAPDQPFLTIGLTTGGVQLWSWKTGELLHAAKFANTSINAVTYSAQNMLAVSGGGQTVLCNSRTLQIIKTLNSESSDWSSCFSEDGATLLIGGYHAQLRYWDVASGALKQKFDSGRLSRIVISPDGKRVLTTALEGANFNLRQFDDGRAVQSVPVVGRFSSLPPHLSADRRFLSLSDDRGQLRVWDLARGTVCESIALPGSNPFGGAYDAASGRVIVHGQAGLQFWKRDVNAQWKTTIAQNTPATAISVAPNGSWGMTTHNESGKIRKYELASGDMLQEANSMTSDAYGIRAFGTSPDGKRIVVVDGSSPQVRVFDATTLRPSQTLLGLNGPARFVAIGDDGVTVAAAAYNRICLWDASTGRLKRTIDQVKENIFSLDLSPDCLHLVAAAGRSLRFWKVETGEPAKVITPKEFLNFTFAKFVNGERVVAGGDLNSELSVWDIKSAERTLTLYGLPSDGDKAQWLAITPEGFFDGSPDCEAWLRWRFSGSLLPGAEFARAMRRRDRILSGLGTVN